MDQTPNFKCGVHFGSKGALGQSPGVALQSSTYPNGAPWRTAGVPMPAPGVGRRRYWIYFIGINFLRWFGKLKEVPGAGVGAGLDTPTLGQLDQVCERVSRPTQGTRLEISPVLKSVNREKSQPLPRVHPDSPAGCPRLGARTAGDLRTTSGVLNPRPSRTQMFQGWGWGSRRGRPFLSQPGSRCQRLWASHLWEQSEAARALGWEVTGAALERWG